MNAFLEERQSIGNRLNDNWGVSNPVAPTPYILWPNADDKRPNKEPWIAFYLVTGNKIPASIVNGSVYGVGSIVIDIAIPLNIADILAYKLADHIMSIFHNVQFGSVWTESVNINNEGFVKDNFYILKTETIYHIKTC